MITLHQALKGLRNNYPHLCSTFGIVQIDIFGSVARNENRSSSDIDLLILFEKTPSLFFLENLRVQLHQILHVEVDIIVDNDELDEDFRNSILKGMVKV